MKVKNRERVLYYDILNILAIISVVALHCGGIGNTFSTARWWKTSLIIEVVCYFAVPIFIMLSGANLLNYREKYDTKTFFQKRFNKVVIPAIAWFIIMAIWKIFIIKTLDVSGMNIVDFVNLILENKLEFTYYYLFVILGLYLTMPFLSQLADDKYRKTLWYVVGIFFVFNSLLPGILHLFKINWNSDFSIQISCYVMYAILGYLLSTQDIQKKYRYAIYIFAVLGMIHRYVTTYILSYTAGKNVILTWKGHSQFTVIILSCALFLFIKNINFKKLEKHKKITAIIAKISSCSFGVYLLHLIVKYYEVEFFNINTHSWHWRTIGVIITYLISLLIVLIMKKIPIIKKIVA